MIKKVLYIFSLLFMFTGVCLADSKMSCSLNDRVELAEIASNVKVTWEAQIDYCVKDANGVETCGIDPNGTDGFYFYNVVNVKIYNLSDRLMMLIESEELSDPIYVDNSFNGDDGTVTIRIDDTSSIKELKFRIYGKDDECRMYNVRNVNLTVPKYNFYSRMTACEGIEDFYLCQKYITFDLDGKTFEENVSNYKNKLSDIKDNGITIDGDNNSVVSTAINYLAKYKYVIIISVLVVGIVLTILVLKSKKVKS